MKKTITLIALAAAVLTASAKDYTDKLQVEVAQSMSASQTATISLNKQDDGRYSFALKNFILSLGGDQMPVGTIQIDNVEAVDLNGTTTLADQQTITIMDGDMGAPDDIWMGPMLGEIPVQLIAEQRDESLYAVLNINIPNLPIKVVFGNGGYQIPNADFEQFHKEKNDIDEPNHWHSFASCTGSWAGFVSGTPHTFVSDVVRPGTSGNSSVMVTSTKIFGVVANGTITTGRMVAGATTASDPKNHAEMDMSKTETDTNGDPFYVPMNGKPEALSVWVKFKQGIPNATYPYATVSAAITDGTYYQDPEDKAYTNVMSRAKNNTIESNGFEWQNIIVPFKEVDKSVDGKAILVTISTNATPGAGSVDTLYIDDLSLVYNQDITVNSIAVKGNALTLGDNMTYMGADNESYTTNDITVDTKAAKVIKRIEETEGGVKAYVTVASDDLNTFKIYTIDLPKGTTGIAGLNTDSTSAAASIYNLQGQRVDKMQPGRTYIVKQNGKTTKVIKK
jgi:hypothetical protein